ncbi:MAG: glucosamine-6-phosphate deaminase [Calditrichaeota bacterium]|nr:glucosamine-6-phosphate deaminase [Calditrichota bacterium]
MGKKSDAISRVEQIALAQSPFDILYPPTEKIKTLVVDNFPALGKLTAMRFLEWVQQHPGGVISLPTGKTPEHFIKWVQYLLRHWEQPDVQRLLEESGVDPSRKPDMKSLYFVQIDEFYPINPWQHNSFYFYVNEFYIEGFGLDRQKALLIDGSKIGLPPGETLQTIWPDNKVDLSLRYRKATTLLEAKQKDVLANIDQWCQEYEDRIRQLGGIGFFLGGIGPDGHIGFNVRGSDHHSTTRLTPTNYETQAAAATDLGGIEVARTRLVITIGLGTITYNPNATAIIIAAGEAKARIVADAIQQEKHVLYPATALQVLPGARFYITMGAAKQLQERQLHLLKSSEQITEEWTHRIVIDLATRLRKKITDLNQRDFKQDRMARVLLEKQPTPIPELTRTIHAQLIQKIQKGAHPIKNKRFLHTEPHHDDIMLGYLPHVVRHIRDASNTHYFVTLTSGFTSVTNLFMKQQLYKLLNFIDSEEFQALMEEGYFAPDNRIGRNRDVWQYLDGVAANSEDMKDEGIARRMLRNLIEVFEEFDIGNLKDRVMELLHYFETQYPGKKDPEYIQKLKGMVREWEAECLWGYFGWSCDNVFHLRLGFYTGDIFTEEPTVERDVLPILELLERVNPDIVTVALDPEASGPDTHYKVLQAITEALKRYQQKSGRSDIKVWGYRNIWYRFHPAEANIFVPVSLNMFSILQNSFVNSFLSQREASFPSYEHDGPFSELAQKIQVEQYQTLKTCLGREWFYEHESPLIRATRGLVFLKELSLPEFYKLSRELRQALENR